MKNHKREKDILCLTESDPLENSLETRWGFHASDRQHTWVSLIAPGVTFYPSKALKHDNELAYTAPLNNRRVYR